MPGVSQVVVAPDDLTAFVADLFASSGLSRGDAMLTAATLVEADLRGVTSHGSRLVPGYLRRLRDGGINRDPVIRVLREGPAYVHLDGDNGPGQVVAHRAMQHAIACARNVGVGIAGVVNSNHFGAAAYWAMMAASADMIGFATTNTTSATMVAPNGAEAAVGNNPLAFAIPAGAEPPIVLDMACGVAAAGKIAVAAMKGEPIPLGWGLTADGQPTTDPNAVKLILPLGAKGFGLAVVTDILAGPLQGDLATLRKAGGRASNQPGRCGHFFLAIDVAALTDPKAFADEVDAQIRAIRATRPRAGFERVYLPGEIEWRQSREHRRNGIPIHPDQWRSLTSIARELGVNVPSS
ncbi:MAG TPA: Ldh family oxidoreductase [Chloroflexota bacterium]|nr:Ldh family oxidoreductase [Chloroflexota bacterium]